MPSGARVRMVARLVMNGGGGENGDYIAIRSESLHTLSGAQAAAICAGVRFRFAFFMRSVVGWGIPFPRKMAACKGALLFPGGVLCLYGVGGIFSHCEALIAVFFLIISAYLWYF